MPELRSIKFPGSDAVYEVVDGAARTNIAALQTSVNGLVDDTLSEAGKAADAQAAGEAIQEARDSAMDAAGAAADAAAELKNILAQVVPAKTGAGETIYIGGTIDAPLAGFKLFGKSEKGGTPAAITNVGDGGNVPVTACGKNLLPLSISTSTISNVDFTVANGTITVNGKRSSSSSSVTILGTVTLPAGSYILSGGAQDSDYYLQVLLPGASAVGESGGTVAFTLTALTLVTIRMFMRGSATASNLVFKPMVRVASDADALFQPYAGVTAQVPTPGGLAGIQVDSSDDYTYADEYDDIYWLCDELDFERGVQVTRLGQIASYDGETLPGKWLSSLDEYAPGTTPTTGAQVVYALAAATETPLTDAQKAAFAQMRSRYGQTRIFTTDALQPMMVARAHIDIPTYIEERGL